MKTLNKGGTSTLSENDKVEHNTRLFAMHLDDLEREKQLFERLEQINELFERVNELEFIIEQISNEKQIKKARKKYKKLTDSIPF